ncbi:MAG: VOC family protein [Chloroflexota bacterium]|nr:VOC family protein [Chloroflexota bacterium]
MGIVVNNLDEALSFSELFDLEKPSEVKEWPDEGVKNAMIKVGSQPFEIMEPVPGGALAKFIEQRGEGIHHVNLIVSDIQSTLKSLKGKGATLIEGQANFAFVHPKSTKGVLFELFKAD